MSQIKIGIACAYCTLPIVFSQGAIELRGKRGGLITELKCPHCDSVFTLHIATKRKRKGKRLVAIEAKRAAEHARAVEDAVKRNLAIAERLLSMPGCACGERIARLGPGDAKERYAKYGHAFASCAISHGIPVEPHHDSQCKWRGTPEECEARGLQHGGTPRKGAA